MSTADERWCSRCLRWWPRKRGQRWATDEHGAWICAECSERRGAA